MTFVSFKWILFSNPYFALDIVFKICNFVKHNKVTQNMNKQLYSYYTSKVSSSINKIISTKSDAIIVLVGLETFLDKVSNKDNIADCTTYGINGTEETFSKSWFSYIFTKLISIKSHTILSLSQFCYLINYIEPSFFADRIFILKDNLRQLYPIKNNEFIEQQELESIEQRPEKLPIHEAEQIRVGKYCYYLAKTFGSEYKSVDLFTEEKEVSLISPIESFGMTPLDVITDKYAIDIAINDILYKKDSPLQLYVKVYEKQPYAESLLKTLRNANALFSTIGGCISILSESSIKDDFIIKPEINYLLKKYWGESAQFRNLTVYRNPNIDKSTVDISQGQIVEAIIDEYDKAKKGIKPKDLFLTAPTGAGKSLLFQIPAFYVSDKGDVTIVVSPLIALMKDQVKAIRTDRNFAKVQYINSELSMIDRDRVIEECKNGNIDILYLAPELLLSYDIQYFLGDRRLGLLIIDEAHLITTWGRDFRVDYWFLGNHIRKIRKYTDSLFPMVAVTATAVYGGENDMVFDSIDSLVMQNPYLFIGKVKRDDITFLINNANPAKSDTDKISQTVNFIKGVINLGLKTLVYVPYTRHVRLLLDAISREGEYKDYVEGYYGSGMDAISKDNAYKRFKNGEAKVMISTKAFGMGIDISDIQVVYHHAPSGILPDYVQEIGRVARRVDLHGFASLEYSQRDQRFSKVLHGMSAIRQWQVQEVLKKIYKIYEKNGKKRNMLVSVDDFDHIFIGADSDQMDQKVLTALMMIEKDYLAKYRYNVLVARPKKLFTKVFAKVKTDDLRKLEQYKSKINILSQRKDGTTITELFLDEIWKEYFNNRSFPLVKADFYAGRLFKNIGVSSWPIIRITYSLFGDYKQTEKQLNEFFQKINDIFSEFDSRFFDKEMMVEKLDTFFNNQLLAEKVAKFILSSYSGKMIGPGVLDNNAFLQQRKSNNGYEYRVFNNRYLEHFAGLLKRAASIFGSSDSDMATRYITKEETTAINYLRLGYFLEMLELGTFEMSGGENPMVFIRINDPSIIIKDTMSKVYRNTILTKTLQRHEISSQIFDHFFLRRMSDLDRWNFIEDFFLGADLDSLLRKYPGEGENNISILDKLAELSVNANESEQNEIQYKELDIYFAKVNGEYDNKHLMTIMTENGPCTMRVKDWINKFPVTFDKERRSVPFKVTRTVFHNLMLSIRRQDEDYYKKIMGLKLQISFPGMGIPVMASIPYSSDPVKFYNWWKRDRNKVFLNTKEMLSLFIKVESIKPGTLLQKDRKLINN